MTLPTAFVQFEGLQVKYCPEEVASEPATVGLESMVPLLLIEWMA